MEFSFEIVVVVINSTAELTETRTVDRQDWVPMPRYTEGELRD